MAIILVVDDDEHIRQLVRLYLEDEGMVVVDKPNGLEALDYYKAHPVDLIVLDVMMPLIDGWELCRELRQAGDKPILMITAKNEPQDKIKGFQLGTDDYIVKPFEPMELVMRIKALLRRYRLFISETIKLGKIILDKSRFTVFFKDTEQIETIPLKEFELLYMLASNPGNVYTRDTLIEKIWGFDYVGDGRTIDTHISRLRERFCSYESEFRIVTLRGLGYRLEVSND